MKTGDTGTSGNLMQNEGFSIKRILLFSVIIFIILVIIIVLGSYFFIALNQASKFNLSGDACSYDGIYLACGKTYMLVFNGYEYNLNANKPFKFPQGDNNLIGLVNENTGESYVFLLKEGEHDLKDTSYINYSVVI